FTTRLRENLAAGGATRRYSPWRRNRATRQRLGDHAGWPSRTERELQRVGGPVRATLIEWRTPVSTRAENPDGLSFSLEQIRAALQLAASLNELPRGRANVDRSLKLSRTPGRCSLAIRS